MYFFILFSIHMHRYLFFLNHLGISCRQDALLAFNIKFLFPRNKDILLHNHSMSNKNRNFNTILFNSVSVSKFFPLSPQWQFFFIFTVQASMKDTHSILLSYILISFNLGQFLRLSLVFITSMLFKSTDYFFLVEWFSIWICLICPHD